ncbi:hypothetical protein OE88DRAFT_1658981 [Heliocybe sulcata]|uniref:UBC core domain-containing protein n=1 Tax=Heliocybe sulcata TaxID=5364 RepID=A0A5C3N2A8_9AGAM|nr:hypothetical protein OE88DRAFT_1658981 [Heliocybe sulcata]
MPPRTALKRPFHEGSQESILSQGPDKHRNNHRDTGGNIEHERKGHLHRECHRDLISNDINASQPPPNTAMTDRSKNEHLKGRRRFIADFGDMQELCAQGFSVRGLRVKQFEAADDEGSFQITAMKGDSAVLTATLLVSDASEYPKNHVFFASCPDSGTVHADVLEDVSSWGSLTIEETVHKLFSLVIKRSTSISDAPSNADTDVEEEEDEDDFFQTYDDLDENFGVPTQDLSRQRLQRDFIEIVAADYRPGVVRFDSNEFIITVSTPIASMNIPGQALMAWDPCLLSKMQHLTLIIAGSQGVYPPLNADGTCRPPLKPDTIKFRVGLTRRYKPTKQQAQDAVRKFGLIVPDEESDNGAVPAENNQSEESEEQLPSGLSALSGITRYTTTQAPLGVGMEEGNEGKFDQFSLSESLDSLLNQTLLRLIPLRLKLGLGWAGAELLLAEAERLQQKPEDLYSSLKSTLVAADKEERKLAESYSLPADPVVHREDVHHINLPLIAFSYLVRRLTLCTRYCIVCHNKLKVDYEALKPFVCENQLCAYQFYLHNRGPSLEYEICTHPTSVDLLVSLTYIAAAEGALDQPLPTGLGLRVPSPVLQQVTTAPAVPAWNAPSSYPAVADSSGEPRGYSDADLVDFDRLDLGEMRTSITSMINSLPPIIEMKQYLEKKLKAGKSKPKLKDIDPSILPAAWSVLRWCVGSCTALLEEITSGEDMMKNIGDGWRQFRFSVGAPDAEAKFKTALEEAKKTSQNTAMYPSLYAFHGSPAKNWHSIIRHGLWYKTVANGRAYGHGVYFAKEGTVSTGTYAQGSSTVWRKSEICPSSCTAVAEIVNLPERFTSTNPYLVVPQTEWIVCRYLLVKGRTDIDALTDPGAEIRQEIDKSIPLVRLDPAHPLTMNRSPIQIPDPSYKIEKLLAQRKQEVSEHDYDDDDNALFVTSEPLQTYDIDAMDVDTDVGPSNFQSSKAIDDWKHNPDWVAASVAHLMPPPSEASPMATVALQRELKAVLKEQDSASSLRELGWYMPPELIGDNLFQWIVELHSFDKDLPIARDMAAKDINSLVFEIRFPPSFPHSPPFFRIIKPRFLPFIRGGGGHVTGGGSICMDLLTSDGWLPSYSISSVLLQIRMAISNLDPRPARLDQHWDRPYGVQEALEGYKRAATTHGWKIPTGLEKLVL